MPMDFPDMDSLIAAAEVHKFRAPFEGEDEATFRSALANHVRPIDLVESEEIRNKVGWDKFSEEQNKRLRARQRTKTAVRNGTLVRLPCSVCGNKKSEAHHADYSKPLEIAWLCRIHHMELHRKPKVTNE